jgi:hypothetical protein
MDIIETSKNIIKFIYKHTHVLNLRKTFTENKELVHPVITQFSNNFILYLASLHLYDGIQENVHFKFMDVGSYNYKMGIHAIAKLMYQGMEHKSSSTIDFPKLDKI